MNPLTPLVDAAGLVLGLLFLAYFARHFAFAVAALRAVPADLAAPFVDTGYEPSVSVLVACRNEEAVVSSLCAALLSLDYPSDLLEVVIVDDGSTDLTGEVLDRLALMEPTLRVLHVNEGSKPAALNAALALATGEIIVVFDADHRPHSDVIRRLVRHFVDPGVGAAQGRCVIGNAGDTPVSRLVALDYHAGYFVNEYGRQALYRLPAFGGANGAVRAGALRAVGGFNAHSVTEDTDLTLRLVLNGWRVRFDVTAVDEEEAVVTLDRYWRQRYRWARGHQQVCRDFRRAVWHAPHLSSAEKIETTMFLFVYHLPVASALGLGVLGVWLSGLTPAPTSATTFVLWTLLFLGPLLELAGGLLLAGGARRDVLALWWFLPLFFCSIFLCTKAWVDGVTGRPYAWVKTQRARELAVA